MADTHGPECSVDDALRFTDDRGEVRLALKTLSVDLVDVFRPGWARREPATASDYF